MPSPNHSTNSGASATFGSALSADIYGLSSRLVKGDTPSQMPSTTPIIEPMTKPIMVA
jgi:hypothetical protein